MQIPADLQLEPQVRTLQSGPNPKSEPSQVSDQTAFFNLEATGKPGRLIEIDDTEKIFSNPTEKATEDYISGRFG
ncbi:phosphate ABC transporter ATPase [Mycolicibacterium gilvum]|uniref:Phosphate ABC transporter ATPase n=1 Tax=Mycolicibacterium gilvum TaxID=1804 RepID=A0A378SUL6_9MYCO|nr:phosphate ABC transporter ATPase [Mycolicibacterium gilvum]